MLVNLFSNKVYEFARINGDISGIDDVWMWIMPYKTEHWKRIKH